MEHDPAPPPLYLFTALAIMVLLHFFIPLHQITPRPWNALGLLPLIAGVALNLAADTALKKHHTTVKPFEKPGVLITTGVYRYSRNPMYLGMSLILVGVAVLMGSLTPYCVIPGFIIIMDQSFIRQEESMLAGVFGEAWATYREKVRRWI